MQLYAEPFGRIEFAGFWPQEMQEKGIA